ncbi:MAG: phosphotransferase family protein [Spongiibacteraceae bacterium]
MTTQNNEDQIGADRNWIEQQIAGKVTRFERIGGGGQRMTFMADVLFANGTTCGYVFQRAATGPYAGTTLSSLPREASVYRELSAREFAIPQFAGLAPDRKAMLSQRVIGSDDFFSLTDEKQKRAVTEDFIAKLAQLHALDPRALQLEDLALPPNPSFAKSRVQVWQDLFDRFVTRPAPVVRFALQWMANNAPANSGDAVLCHGDLGPGNFLFDGNRVSALLDWELVHLGDRHDDLGMLSLRSYQMSGMGNLAQDLSLYEKFSGVKIDRGLVAYYRVVAILLGVTTSLTALDRQQVGRVAIPLYYHLVPYLQHLLVSALIDWAKVDVEEPELFTATNDVVESEVLATIIEELEDETRHPASSINMPGLKELALHLQARADIGTSIDKAELDDLQHLLGSRPRSVPAGLRALDERLLRGDLNDLELLRWSYRHTRRQAQLWPAWRERFAIPLLPVS